MFKPKEIDLRRVDNVKTILKRENLTQKKFAEKIKMSPENLNRIIRLRHPLTEATAETIHVYFPTYRIEWILGYDDFMTEEELTRATDAGIRNEAPITVLDTALQNVCRREGIDVPHLDCIPELVLLESQLQDFAEMLMRNYIHRNKAHFWNTFDSFTDPIESELDLLREEVGEEKSKEIRSQALKEGHEKTKRKIECQN